MTTIRVTPGRDWIETPTAGRTFAQHVLLASGVLSSMLYVATDVLGGLSYDGYSFTSQVISELAAIGAPSKPLVDPLFLTFNVLSLAFAFGVFREGHGRGRVLRITGALLVAYAAIGLTGAVFFNDFLSMQQRGHGGFVTDVPHIAFTGVIVLFLLLSIGFGAFALGSRFRIYSLVTLLIVVAVSAVTPRYATLLGAGQPTPWFGVLERVEVYSLMLWLAVLSTALLRPRVPTTQPSLQ